MHNADMDPTSSHRRIEPVYRAFDGSGEIIVYQGPLTLTTAQQEHTATGQLELRLAPTTELVVRLIEDEVMLGLQLQNQSTAVAIPEGSPLDPPEPLDLRTPPDDTDAMDPSLPLNHIQVGHVEDAERYIMHISGALRAMLPSVTVEDGMQPQLEFVLPEWRLTLAPVFRPKGDNDFSYVIAATPLSRPTNVGMLEELRWRTFILLSLVAGREIGVGPTCGIDTENRVVWLETGAPRLRAGKPGVAWCPRHLVASAIPTLAHGFAALSDEATVKILDRAIGHLLAAGGGEVLDIRIPMATAGLELISWSILQQRGWLDTDALSRLPAAARTRLLLQWAGIPVEIPDAFRALSARRSRVGRADWGGPEVLFNVRNALVHPPKRSDEPGWPHSDELLESWQLATWYLELTVLRVLGYNGSYWSRLRLGRWATDVEPVPWARDQQ